MARPKSIILAGPGKGDPPSLVEELRQLREEMKVCERDIVKEEETYKRNILALGTKRGKLLKQIAKLEGE